MWVKLNEERGNLLIGHVSCMYVHNATIGLVCIFQWNNRLLYCRSPVQVTLSLTDIALECLCTGSGTHQQNYVLVAAEAAKAYVR